MLRKRSSPLPGLIAMSACECSTQTEYPGDCGKTTGAVFYCSACQELINAADLHLWGLDHFFRQLFKTESLGILESKGKGKQSFNSDYSISVSLLWALCLWKCKPAERDVTSPCGKQAVRCLHYSWPSPEAVSSDQPSENKWKMVWSTLSWWAYVHALPVRELLDSWCYEVEQLSIAYPDIKGPSSENTN